jgi:polysaccharide export outer membrane protein
LLYEKKAITLRRINFYIMTKLKTLLIFITLLAAIGCRTPRDVAYFQDIENNSYATVRDSADIRLMVGDKLSIVVHARKAELASQFNLSVQSQRVGYTNLNNGSYQMSTYTIDDEGNIDFPELGTLHLEGLSRGEVIKLIKTKLIEGEYFLDDDFVVTVEFDGMFFTILGEVSRPSRYAITKDRLTILEALGMAGDMAIQGKRINVKVLRDEGQGKRVYMLDFTKANEVLNSPVYYIQQNDVVYVEANDMRKRQTTNNANTLRTGSFWISMASILTTLYLAFIKK